MKTLLLLLIPLGLLAQTHQTIQGTVLDQVTQQPIIGATIIIQASNPPIGTTTNIDGRFILNKVPLGRQVIEVSYIGYKDYQSEGLIVSSTRGIDLEIELLEASVSLGEVVVTAAGRINKPVNELSVVSTRSFSADETDRIAASVNDPSRLALTYPGVSQGNDDNTNDLIIRGNSSFGMTWRLEGMEIPNPNHFAFPGTSGGGITVFSAQLLSRSDFSTGGMPAEYGNAISGFMDIHFRKGNKRVREHRAKVGILGIDLATEGPIKSQKSSYLVNYRYSTLGILSQMNVNLVGERTENTFQDLSFNIAFDENEKNRFTVFGLGGLSREHERPIDEPTERNPEDFSHFRDRIRDSNVGVLGGTYTRFIDDKSYFKIGLAGMGSTIDFFADVLDSLNQRTNYEDELHQEVRLAGSAIYNRKINSGLRLKTGIYVNYILDYRFFRQVIQVDGVENVNFDNATASVDGQGSTYTLQYFAQLSKQIGARLVLNGGLHLDYLGLNQTSSIEPRLSAKYQIDTRQSIGLAYGWYSKVLPMAGYFYTKRDTLVDQSVQISLPNQNLPLIKSQHLIGSYNFAFPNGLRFSAEAYYQRLSNVPVSLDPQDTYWMLNFRGDYPRQSVEGTGTGENYGIDLLVEKFFSNRLFLLINGSFFRAYFTPQNGERYHSQFSNDFVSALSVGREFNLRKERTLQVGARILYSGGTRYTPLDEAAAAQAGRFVPIIEQTFTLSIPNYFRIDTRIAYRYNRPKLSGSISLDIQNILNRTNASGVGYSIETNRLLINNHTSGFAPVLAFQFDF